MVEYHEAHETLEEIVQTDEYQEIIEDFPNTYEVKPDVAVKNGSAVFYLQVHDTFKDEKFRKVLGEYDPKQDDIKPVELTMEELETTLMGTGKIIIDEQLLEPRRTSYNQF